MIFVNDLWMAESFASRQSRHVKLNQLALQLMFQGTVVARVLWAVGSLRSPRSSKRGAYDSYGFIVVANVLEERVFSRRGRN